MSSAETQWGIKFGDGDVAEYGSRKLAEKWIAKFREFIADPQLTEITAKDYEPMSLVSRNVSITDWTPVKGGE